jgi:hypothetical protein
MTERLTPLSEPERSGTSKTHDLIYPYRGYHTAGGRTRIRIYDRPAGAPHVIATELPENTNTSITNLCEYLAWEIGRAYLPGRFEHEQPFDWVELYPGERFHPIKSRREDAYSLAHFEDYKPRVVWLGGERRIRIGQPTWTHLSREQLETMLGMPLDEA